MTPEFVIGFVRQAIELTLSIALPMLLVGLGVDELSVSVPLIPTIKARVRELTLKDCQVLAQQVLGLVQEQVLAPAP